MAYQKNGNDSRNIFCCGIVQNGVGAKTITTPEQVIEWTRICAATFDRYLGTNDNFRKQAALAIIQGHLNGCQNLQQLLGDKDNPGLHQKLQNEIAIFQDDPELYYLYKQLFNLTESRLQYDK